MSRLSRLWDGGHWTSQSLKGLGPQRKLSLCNIDEVAAQFRLKPTSGMEFRGDLENKIQARRAVRDLFSLERHPEPIRVLSMPGSKWLFEAMLLHAREDVSKFTRGNGPVRTEIHSVENDRAVYYEALSNVPGFRHRKNVIVDLGQTKYAERVLSYLWIKRYIFADVDDLMRQTQHIYDCAWLDYFGPLTVERVALIKRFFATNVRKTLVVTSLRARWNPGVKSVLRQFDDHEAWLRAEFVDGAEVEHCLNYYDTSPMMQFAISKMDDAPPDVLADQAKTA